MALESAFDSSDDSGAALGPAVREQDRELVAAEPRTRVGLADAAAQALRDAQENEVARMVPVPVVTCLNPSRSSSSTLVLDRGGD